MENKHTMKMVKPFTDDFIAMSSSNSIYTDDLYYKEKMHESNSGKSYPIKMMLFNVRWILTEHGRLLLQAIHQGDKLDLYNLPAL